MRTAGVFLLALLLGPSRAQQPDVGPLQVFPPDNPWNWDVSGHARHPLSDTYIASIGGAALLRADFSFEINVVANSTPVTIAFPPAGTPEESDPGPGFGSPPGGAASGLYRFPASPRVEGGGDAHCLSVDTANGLLYETYQMNLATSPWSATNGAIFDLGSNALRPDGWTSGDAAGLPIFPGLLRYEEVVAGAIRHALRVTVPASQDAHLFPARHDAGAADATLPPMGLRLRLKAGTDLSGITGAPLIVLQGLKTYGLIVADNGSPWYISTTIDDRWGAVNSLTTGLQRIRGSDFEAVQTVDGSGNPIPPGASPGGGGSGGGGGGCGATGLETLVLLVLLRRIRGPQVGGT
jgi:hypothetical protein